MRSQNQILLSGLAHPLAVLALTFIFLADLPAREPAAEPHLVQGTADAPHRGVFEVVLQAKDDNHPHFESLLQVTFTRPDGSAVTVDGFPDGARTFRARAYCDQIGRWKWSSSAQAEGLGGQAGEFQVVASELPGKLRKHRDDPRQFAYDNGDWFLHLGDTGYRYVTDTEPKWQEYIDQAAQMGATKVRVWFCRSRHAVEALFTPDRTGLNLPYWQEIDRRVTYALNRHPQLILQLIPYGEDTAELKRYMAGDHAAPWVARHAQARFSAFPNVHWCISNDMILRSEPDPQNRSRHLAADVIRRIGTDMAKQEPWGTLLTNHQSRGSGYAFVDEPWSDIITLEDLDQVHGQIILKYREQGQDPVINDEDRYELYRPPADPRYFFRRLMWASLLSGGHATYGGLKTYEPYDGKQQGVQGYFDARERGVLTGGADDFVHIHTFFRESGVTLVRFTPDDSLVAGGPLRAKCIYNQKTHLVYLANPSEDRAESARPAQSTPSVTVTLPEQRFRIRWFAPTSGQWYESLKDVSGPRATLQAPGDGDWVLLLEAK